MESIVFLLTALSQAGEPVQFDRDIRPLLASRCFYCHGHFDKIRKAGLNLDTADGLFGTDQAAGVVVPGDPDASELLQRVQSSDSDELMPPPGSGHDPLDPDEIELIRRWIEQGATWHRHWAWVSPERSNVSSSQAHPIDFYVNRRIELEGLVAAEEADRMTLLRRASLDLTGLPPTPEEVDAFLADGQPGAWERQVDRLLSSPHFGERWARVWLDLARYADSRGYEKDADRTIWPWRDWVIDAINDDMPFDRFTIEQLAGDMVPEATEDQVLATAFHRNTMTNDEGGTDDEEFRVAAIVDRVNTTMQTWMGVTIGCAQCHDHPSDLFTQQEYYQLFAMLNQTQDADRTDEHPVISVLSNPDQELLANAMAKREAVDRRLQERARTLPVEQPVEAVLEETPRDWYVVDDALPLGAAANMVNGEPWPWKDGTETLPAKSGTRVHLGTATGPIAVRQQYFESAWLPLILQEGDRLVAHAWLDPDDPPAQVMLQFHRPGDWEHRIYWGEDHNPWGEPGTTAHHRMGDLPPTGEWVRLEFDPSLVGLGPGDAIDGWAFTQAGGTMAWDAAGVVRAGGLDVSPLHSLLAFESFQQNLDTPLIPGEIQAIVNTPRSERDANTQDRLESWYLRNVQIEGRAALAIEQSDLDSTNDRVMEIQARSKPVPIMKAMDPGMERTTHILERGSFLAPGEVVTPGVPAQLHALSSPGKADRLALARWLVARDNPLTARVHVNRTWERLFGRGLVQTLEDFGSQGERPTHPDLLDWLAVEFMERGWSHKELCKLIVMSDTYRRAAVPVDQARRIDPENRWLSYAPRVRLEAEAVRDQALAVSGLLDPVLHGPPVFPDQPPGLWQVTYDNRDWPQGSDRQRHRRGLYTFWRRSSPYPSMTTFDAPSREVCTVRRIRTNTPLQALVTLNDPVYVEAAKALAGRMVDEGGDELESQITRGIWLALGRPPRPEEVNRLVDLAHEASRYYTEEPLEAEAFLASWPGTRPESIDPRNLAALAVIANVLLNLDEVLTRG